MAKMLSRAELAAETGIPIGSIERELMLAGLNPRPSDTRLKPGTNLTEYVYPGETAKKLRNSRERREARAAKATA